MIRKPVEVRDHSRIIRNYAVIMAVAWTLLVAAITLTLNRDEMQHERALIRNEARTHFEKDQAFRLWGASHGGVYVPSTEHTPPNPNLAHIPDRDIVTSGGKKLTLMNPAYMVRQLMEDYQKLYNIRGRITSLQPLRSENAPDTWERAALESFDRGITEVNEFADIDGKPYLRLMRPLITKESCLKCHEHQGYKTGDVRGGVGVAVPAEPYFAAAREEIVEHVTALGLLWLIGVTMLIFGSRHIQRKVRERDQAGAALQASEQRLSFHLHHTPIAAIEWDLGFEIVEWNSAAEQVFGHTKDEALGKHAADLLVPESARKHVHQVWKGLLEHTGGEHSINENLTKDGRTIICEWNNTALVDDAGKVYGVASLVQDITERKHFELALRESEHKFRTIVESMDIIPWKFNLEEDQFTFFGNQSEAILGYPVESWTNLDSWASRVHPDDRDAAVDFCLTSTRNGQDHEFEYRCVTPAGRSVWVRDIVTVRTNQKGEPCELVGYMLDITETKRLRELESRAGRLETAGKIAGQVAHDFNNLLGPLMAYPEFMREDLPANHPVLEYVADIETSAQKIADINQQLLALGRRGHYAQDIVSLNTVVRQAMKELTSLPHTVACDAELADDLMNIKGGAAQLNRVLSNLLNNALESIQGNGRIAVKTENHYIDDLSVAYGRVPKGEYVKLTISDTGCGIPDNIVQNIFDPFFTSKTTDKKRGSGLGLSVVDAVVKDHDGYLDLTTKVGEGTSFIIYFPITRETADKQTSTDVGGHESLLVIDDDEIQREVSAKILARLGYNVATVESGEQALEFLKDNPQDLLILDMIMPPGIDGAETYRRVLKIAPDQRAIIVSGFAESDRVKAAQELGAGAFVKKPLTRSAIAAAVRKELDRTKKPIPISM